MPWAAPWNGFGQTAMPTTKVAIVAALEREVWPLVKDWPVSHREHEGRWFKFFESGPMVLVCGGMGSEAARRAAEAIISLYQPSLLILLELQAGLNGSRKVVHSCTPGLASNAAMAAPTHQGPGLG